MSWVMSKPSGLGISSNRPGSMVSLKGEWRESTGENAGEYGLWL